VVFFPEFAIVEYILKLKLLSTYWFLIRLHAAV